MYKTLGFIASTSLIVIISASVAEASEEISCYIKQTTPIYSSTGENAKRVGQLSPGSRIDLSAKDQGKEGWIRIFSFARRERLDVDDISPRKLPGQPVMYIYAKNGLYPDFTSGCVMGESSTNPQGQTQVRPRAPRRNQ